MRGQGEYIATVVLTMVIILIASLAINWARYIENIGRSQVIDIMKSKEKLVVIWPYEGDRNKVLVINQWDGNSRIQGFLIFYGQRLFIKILNNSYRNLDLSIGHSMVIDLKYFELNDNFNDIIDRICVITVFQNLFCNEYMYINNIPSNIKLKISSSPLQIYVSSHDVITSMYAYGEILIYGEVYEYYNRERPFGRIIYQLKPFLPDIPTAMVYTQGNATIYYAGSSKRNLTVVANYISGFPQIVSAYLDGESYNPINVTTLSDYHVLVVDGVPFRLFDGYTGTVVYRADIYYAYVSSYNVLYRVYALTYPVKLEPLDQTVFVRIFVTGLRSPVLFTNYTMRSDGTLAIGTIYAGPNATYGLNIPLARSILYIPIVRNQASPPTTSQTLTVVGLWRNFYERYVTPTTATIYYYPGQMSITYTYATIPSEETSGTVYFSLTPVGKGVWANVTGLKYMNVVGNLVATRYTTNPRYIALHPIQWVFTDWNGRVVGDVLFRFTTVAVVDPTYVTGHIIDYIGYIPDLYKGSAVVFRYPTTMSTITTSAYRPVVTLIGTYTTATVRTFNRAGVTYAFLTNVPLNANVVFIAPSLFVNTRHHWYSLVFVEGGLFWLDYEYILVLSYLDIYRTATLAKCPLRVTAVPMCPATQVPYFVDAIGFDFDIVVVGVPAPAYVGKIDVYFMYYGEDLIKTITYKITRWIYNYNLKTWTSTVISPKTTTVQVGQMNFIGRPSEPYEYWIIEFSSGGITRYGYIKNFDQPPQKIETTVIGTSTITYTIPVYPPQYLGVSSSSLGYIIAMISILILAIYKTWRKLPSKPK
ncbi:hypothetical protein Igag_1882 [Ignisphaera aggregans DSM 17230]|uniref:Uncharacterized protein n=1 Tax=Ignisphaera aggregans (strain DSM 17230 / JCM 13409 / AQ1.S1) TaxID=583356 RepID=E0ST15_IGNAA|nr:hypothetical protein Igag_1882 [Ignisphaera aggregans DSM 17230]